MPASADAAAIAPTRLPSSRGDRFVLEPPLEPLFSPPFMEFSSEGPGENDPETITGPASNPKPRAREPALVVVPAGGPDVSAGTFRSCPWPSRGCVPRVMAPPARNAAVTSVVSASSTSVAPAFFALRVWMSMQYGHWVVSATATAISSLYFRGISPPRTTASSNATNALNASGASSPILPNLAKFLMSYIAVLLVRELLLRDPRRPD